MPNLAISLHATHEEQRDALVPINRKYDLEALIDACKRFPVKRRSRITFEYVLLNGVNDTPEDARRLVKLLDGIKGKVNLLPLNAAPGIPFERPDGRARRRVREDPRRQGPHRVGAQEPRPRHPRRLRSADRRRRAARPGPPVGRPGARRTALSLGRVYGRSSEQPQVGEGQAVPDSGIARVLEPDEAVTDRKHRGHSAVLRAGSHGPGARRRARADFDGCAQARARGSRARRLLPEVDACERVRRRCPTRRSR